MRVRRADRPAPVRSGAVEDDPRPEAPGGLPPAGPPPAPRAGISRLGRLAALAPVAGALGVAAFLASCGGGVSGSAPRLPASKVVSIEATSRTLQLTLTAADTSNYGGFNFDGYSTGAMTVHVPIGWTVEVTCHNASSVLTHSCSVIDDVPIAPSGGPVAFPGSSTPTPVNGIGCGATYDFSFVTSRVGRFRIACLVSGHEADGMWDWLVVTEGGEPFVTT
jgi:hypothetical protein